ncbi:uncharacterized protein BJ171DRAFT_209217 [Polychytrium aggregatum]|uniref:uncharacterized protein n=1 Tax=Polychytrium aggregatum TaxID=110093 RepID=UPI0022FED402|nr:uncharacterized protein BJ171DRAFT_209217 [Polychytrium aggregatum]KAI9208527.1 hypothetical protein BJ171DRAFT_209217 [Polychytrium aggregatum]
MGRLTQLQEAVDKITQILYTSTGVLQRDAPLLQVSADIPVTAWTEEQIQQRKQDLTASAKEMAKDIVETSRVIDYLIDKLPGITQTEEQQIHKIQELEVENQEIGRRLEASVLQGETLLREIRSTLRLIAEDQAEFFRDTEI